MRAYQHEETVQTKEPLVELIFRWTRHNHGIMVPWIPGLPVKLLEQTWDPLNHNSWRCQLTIVTSVLRWKSWKQCFPPGESEQCEP